MKKFLVLGFFAVCLTLSVFAMKMGATIRMGDEEIKYRKIDRTLSDTEVENYNKYNTFEKPLQIRDGYRSVLYHELKETRTKTLFGWDTQVDTLKTYVTLEECKCQ